MVTVFTLSDHGAIKRRPRVLLRFLSESPEYADNNIKRLSYSVRDGAASYIIWYLLVGLLPKEVENLQCFMV